MNKLRLLLFILIFSILFAENIFAHVGLDYPVGGENFQTGEVVEIRWHIVIYHGSCDWDLLFSNDGGSTWQPIISNLQESQLSYNWTVPSMATDSGQVKIVQDNATGMDYSDASGNFIINTTTGINELRNLSENFVLYPAYPNPFNPETTIKYSLPAQSKVTLKIYNILGEEIRTLVDEVQTQGSKSISWNGQDNYGQQVGSGVYIYSLKTNKTVLSKKLFLIR